MWFNYVACRNPESDRKFEWLFPDAATLDDGGVENEDADAGGTENDRGSEPCNSSNNRCSWIRDYLESLGVKNVAVPLADEVETQSGSFKN